MTRYEAYIGDDWKEVGIANVVVAKIRADRLVEFGVFLVDLFCLGVKDAMLETEVTESEYRRFLSGAIAETIRLPFHPACAKKMIEGAIAYAETFGFAPHRDYRKARRVLSGIDASTCPEVFEYGEDGRPCYVRGPDDSEERVDRVLARLEMKCGLDGFNFVDPSDDGEEEALAARGDLIDWLDAEADEVPRFYEVSGMITAMQLSSESLSPALLVNVLWPKQPGLANLEEAQDFLTILKDYWNEVAGMVADTLDPEAPADETCIDVREEDFEAEDAVGLLMAMREWATGFLRATELWSESWLDALNRPDLAPHWELLRCFAKVEEPGNLARIEQMAVETPPRNLGRSVAAIARALRPPMPRAE